MKTNKASCDKNSQSTKSLVKFCTIFLQTETIIQWHGLHLAVKGGRYAQVSVQSNRGFLIRQTRFLFCGFVQLPVESKWGRGENTHPAKMLLLTTYSCTQFWMALGSGQGGKLDNTDTLSYLPKSSQLMLFCLIQLQRNSMNPTLTCLWPTNEGSSAALVGTETLHCAQAMLDNV